VSHRPTLTITSQVAEAAGELLVGAIEASVEQTGRCRLGVPGGSSPGPVLAWLAHHLDDLLHDALTLTWVDERHEASGADASRWQDLPDTSNLRGTCAAWLSARPTLPDHVPLDAPGSLDEARAAVEAAFDARLGGLDVVLLGTGPDGHVASLFPGHPALDEVGSVLAIPDSPKPPPERLSLSLAVLQQVRCSVLVATGAAKAPVLTRCWQGPTELPLSATRPDGGDWHWVLDPDAASTLGDDPR
jgi:6-phosphogluconolactonase